MMTMGVGLYFLPPTSMPKSEAALPHPSGEVSLLPASPARKLKCKGASDFQSLCSQQQIWEEKAGPMLVLCSNKPHWLLTENLPPFPHSAHSLKNPNPCKLSALLWLKGFVPRSLKSHNMPLAVRVLQVTFSATETACWE